MKVQKNVFLGSVAVVFTVALILGLAGCSKKDGKVVSSPTKFVVDGEEHDYSEFLTGLEENPDTFVKVTPEEFWERVSENMVFNNLIQFRIFLNTLMEQNKYFVLDAVYLGKKKNPATVLEQELGTDLYYEFKVGNKVVGIIPGDKAEIVNLSPNQKTTLVLWPLGSGPFFNTNGTFCSLIGYVY
jgi:hypothetical protein